VTLDKNDLAGRVRLGAALMVAVGAWLIIWALAYNYGSSSAAVSNAIIAALVIILALVALRAPLEAAPVCWITGALGIWLIAAPFVLGYTPHVLGTGNNMWSGLLVLLASAFSAGEAMALHQPLDAHD
jgi:uncharacterized membrane protein